MLHFNENIERYTPLLLLFSETLMKANTRTTTCLQDPEVLP